MRTQHVMDAIARGDEKTATEAGIRLDGFVGSDNYEGGKVAGEYLIEVTGGKARVGGGCCGSRRCVGAGSVDAGWPVEGIEKP